jgi:hypothetical protein
MTPAEELRAAAGALRAREDAAWNFMGGNRRTFEGAVAALLEQTASRHALNPPHGPSDDDPQCRTCIGSFQYEEGAAWPCPDVAAALVVARAITGGETP